MNIAAKPNSKMHSPAPAHHAAVTTSSMGGGTSSQTARMGIPGEIRDLPGESSRDFVTMDYGEGRHMALDSEFAQPAYSGHGKVRVGRSSDI